MLKGRKKLQTHSNQFIFCVNGTLNSCRLLLFDEKKITHARKHVLAMYFSQIEKKITALTSTLKPKKCDYGSDNLSVQSL